MGRRRSHPDFTADAARLVQTLTVERDRLASMSDARSVALVDGDWFRACRPDGRRSFMRRCTLLGNALRTTFAPLDSVAVYLTGAARPLTNDTQPVFTIVTSPGGRGKAADSRLAVAAVTVPTTTGHIVLVGGDGDLLPAVEALTAQGRPVTLVTDRTSAATHLVGAATDVIDLARLLPDT